VSEAQSIIQAEALAWLSSHPAEAHTSVVTSLPDRSELRGLSFNEWQTWFVDAAEVILRWLPVDGVAIFYQTDVRHAGIWVDKGQWVLRAAEAAGCALIWHKIVCRSPPGTASTNGQPTYSHLICLARSARAPRRPVPDVLADAGPATSRRVMGDAACQLACAYLRDETTTRCVVDPFCGQGSVLAVASRLGFSVIGIDLSAKQCRIARTALSRAHTGSDAFESGAQLFDRGEFFEAHEAWEERWRVTTDEIERRGLQGLIQVAAAFHKLFVARAPDSALRLLDKGLDKLEVSQFAPGFDLAEFRTALRACRAELDVTNFAPHRVPRLLDSSTKRDGNTPDPNRIG
jgi:hypothetical protein